MFDRIQYNTITELMESFPAVGIIGPRQTGKTTLAKIFGKDKPSIYLDLELSDSYNRLQDAEGYLRHNSRKLVIIDEVQRMPELFPILRGLIDEDRRAGRFLLLGSASPLLLRNSSESLAGRIVYEEMHPLLLSEVDHEVSTETLWLRGGFPDALKGKSSWIRWMESFTVSYLEKDLPQMGFPATRIHSERLWTMLAGLQGSTVNYSDLSKSLEMSASTIKRYIDFMSEAFLIRQLQPYSQNMSKRVVKAPKVYIRDSGVMHYLIGVEKLDDLMGNPKMGASWEGFVIQQIAGCLPPNRKLYFYRTHDGAELDLVVTRGGIPTCGIEIKFGSDARPSKGNTMAAQALQTKKNFVVNNGSEEYSLSNGFLVTGLKKFLVDHLPYL